MTRVAHKWDCIHIFRSYNQKFKILRNKIKNKNGILRKKSHLNRKFNFKRISKSIYWFNIYESWIVDGTIFGKFIDKRKFYQSNNSKSFDVN